MMIPITPSQILVVQRYVDVLAKVHTLRRPTTQLFRHLDGRALWGRAQKLNKTAADDVLCNNIGQAKV